MKTNLLKCVILTTLTVPALAACRASQTTDLVITDKGANKLVFRSLSEPRFENVLVCDGSDWAKLFYQTINVGDTITSRLSRYHPSEYRYGSNRYGDILIRKINGRDAQDVMLGAKQDSVVARARREIQRTK